MASLCLVAYMLTLKLAGISMAAHSAGQLGAERCGDAAAMHAGASSSAAPKAKRKKGFDVGDVVSKRDQPNGTTGVISEVTSEPGDRTKTFIIECAAAYTCVAVPPCCLLPAACRHSNPSHLDWPAHTDLAAQFLPWAVHML